MPVLRIVNDITTDGPKCANIWHVFTNPGSESDGANEAIAAIVAFQNAIQGIYHNSVSGRVGDNVVTVDQTPNVQVPATPGVWGGTATGNQDPRQAAGIITWRTGVVGRSYRGRTYIGPMVSGAVGVDGLSLTSTWVTNLQNAADGLLAAPAPNSIWVVWSPTLGQNTAISSAQARPYIGTVRGRLT